METFFPDDKFNIFPNLIFQTAFISQLKFWLTSCYLYLWFKNCARHILKESSFFSGRRHTIVYPLHHNCEVRAMGKKSKLSHKLVSESRVLQRPMAWPACLCPKSPWQMEGHQQDKRRLVSLRLRISQFADQAHFSRHLPGQGSTGIQKAPLPSKLDKYPNKATAAAWSSLAEALQLVSRSTMSYR